MNKHLMKYLESKDDQGAFESLAHYDARMMREVTSYNLIHGTSFKPQEELINYLEYIGSDN